MLFDKENQEFPLKMLFNFSLAPLEEIVPWGEPGNENLHWFGLTDGTYWIEVGGQNLLEYSLSAGQSGAPEHCDYQVVRLWEDIIDIVPCVTEPVPQDLIPYISGESAKIWNAKSSSWFADADTHSDDDHFWGIVDGAVTWLGGRRLDTLYLSPGANIQIWSDEKLVHIEWDNRDMVRDGNLVWTGVKGSYELSRADFMAEVHSFHNRLMEQMDERVKQVVAGALRPDIKIDLLGLQKEHQERCRQIEEATIGPPQPTDWRKVREAIKEIERGPYGLNIISH